MKKREAQKEQRRQAILLAGLNQFVRKGYSATKISDIAEEADMSVGLLFHYFESKEKLYEELVGIGLRGTQMALDYDKDYPLQYFEKVAGAIFQSIKENPFVSKMFMLMAQALQSESTPQPVKDLAGQVNNIEISVSFIEQGQKQGCIKQGNPLSLSTAFWCSIQGIAEELALHPDTPCPDADWIVDILRKKG